MLHEAGRQRDDVGNQVVTLIEMDVDRAQGFPHFVPSRDDGGVPKIKNDEDCRGNDQPHDERPSFLCVDYIRRDDVGQLPDTGHESALDSVESPAR